MSAKGGGFGCERDALRNTQKNVGYYSGASLIRNTQPLGPYSRTKSRALWWT